MKSSRAEYPTTRMTKEPIKLGQERQGGLEGLLRTSRWTRCRLEAKARIKWEKEVKKSKKFLIYWQMIWNFIKFLHNLKIPINWINQWIIKIRKLQIRLATIILNFKRTKFKIKILKPQWINKKHLKTKLRILMSQWPPVELSRPKLHGPRRKTLSSSSLLKKLEPRNGL